MTSYYSDYKTRLIKLDLLPLMYYMELNDIMFCMQSLKSSSDNFNILEFISFSSQTTRSDSHSQMIHLRSFSRMSDSHHYFFNRIPRLWNRIPPLDLDSSSAIIKSRLTSFLQAHFISLFDPNNPCSFHFMCPCSRCSYTPPNTIIFICMQGFQTYMAGCPTVLVTCWFSHFYLWSSTLQLIIK